MMLPLFLAAAAASLSPTPSKTDSCANELRLDSGPYVHRAIVAEDLIELFDIGSIPDFDDQPIFAVSPGGDAVAIPVRRGSVSRNGFCSGLYLASRDGRVRLLDSGSDVLYWQYGDYYGTAGFPTGIPKPITPHWTPDGSAVAYLKPINGVAQVWLVKPDGSGGHALTASAAGIDDFRFSGDGRRLIFRVLPEGKGSTELDREALSGFHYDNRFFPVSSSRPLPLAVPPSAPQSLDLESGLISGAAPTEALLLSGSAAPLSAPGQWEAIIEEGPGRTSKVAARRDGKLVRCEATSCSEAFGTPWIAGKDHVLYLRRSGWARSEVSIFDWPVGASVPREVYRSSDLLLSCGPFGQEIICAQEASRQPRRLVSINSDTGVVTSLFDPNPAFGSLLTGKVERRHWRNSREIECFGDLVYPPDYRPGRTYPLIVVQYESRGFLRGGTGDEFPIQLFAQAGYLVLSIQRPRSPFAGRPDLSSQERQRLQLRGFTERRSIVSAIETEVRALIAEGLVDPARVGITGLSDGSTTVQFTALHSRLFKAASLTGCCWESSQAWLLGPALQAEYERLGWPDLTGDHRRFWSDISLARAHRIHMPLLIQAADKEFAAALESYTALRERHQPIDLYVFPEEHHVKRQPAHRANIYRRNIAWFDFWLRGIKDGPAADPKEIAHWDALVATAIRH